MSPSIGRSPSKGSDGTDKTVERVYPARTLFVKSPQIKSENPFNRLYETNGMPSPTDDGEGMATNIDMILSTDMQVDPYTRDSLRTDDEARHVGSTSIAEDKRNSQAEEELKKEFTELNRVKDNQGTQKINDMASTHPVEAEFDTSDEKEPRTKDSLMTKRFETHMSEDGVHRVATFLGGEGVQRCEDEPIHTPGAVQGFGVLVTLRQVDSRYEVIHVSENSTEILGLSPDYLFSLPSFTDVLTEHDRDTLMDQLEFLEESNSSDFAINAENTSTLESEGNVSPEVFILSGRRQDRDEEPWKCWTALHRTLANGDLIILEFELFKDERYPLMMQHKRGESPATSRPDQEPERGLSTVEKSGMDGDGFDAFSEEDLLESTTSASKPLRRIKRSVIAGDENGTMEIFSILSQINEQLNGADNLQTFLKIVVGIVKDITRFHRVMLYQFDDQWNGQVVAELVDWQQTKDLFQGLYFPATDIPAQARALYTINKVRILYDRDQTTARLVCRNAEALEKPFDMTHCFMRAMSPIHLKYLANMGVRASMSISITAFGELWGLIACHTYGDTSMRCSFLVRKLCRLMGEQISHNIERLSYAARLTARKLVHSPSDRNPSGYIVSKAEDLLGLFDADIGMLSIGDEGKILGGMENSQEAIALRDYFRAKRFDSITPSNDLRADFPDLDYAPGFKTVAGVMFIPLSRSGEDFLLFFRRGQLKKVHWAGNPYEKVLEKNRGQPSILLPRQSFKVWSESVVGRCKEWAEDQIETAAVLCLVYGKFIEVWRERQQALQTSKLASILLSNAGHEVRTPLNAVINYLEIALEGDLPQETRENLEKSHTASKSLVYVINDLLDLTKSERGNDLFRNEPFDLLSTVREAVSMYQSQAFRADVNFTLQEDDQVPRRVVGDQAKIRQVISNVTANALKYTTQGYVAVQTQLLAADDESVDVAIIVKDTGCGISEEKLDAIFSNFESVEAVNLPDVQADEKINAGTGLGLAIVARVVRNMNGQLKAESKVGRGSTFTFVFHFNLPDAQARTALSSAGSNSTRKRSTQGKDSAGNKESGNTESTRFARKSSSDGQVVHTSQGSLSETKSFPSNVEHEKTRQRMTLTRRHSTESHHSLHDQANELHRRQAVESQATGIDSLMSSMIASPIGSSDDNPRSVDAGPTGSNSGRGSVGQTGSNSGRGSLGQTRHVKRISASSGSGGASDHGKEHSVSSNVGGGRNRSRSLRHSSEMFNDKVSAREASSNEYDTRPAANVHSASNGDLEDQDYLQTLDEERSNTSSEPRHPRLVRNTNGIRVVRAVKMDSDDVIIPRRYAQSPTMRDSSPQKALPDGGLQTSTNSNVQPNDEMKKLKILVAEDDAINRSILQKRLQMDKHTIKLAFDGSDCYDEYAKDSTTYDVILMDMQMPVLDGMAASRKIRQFEETCYAERKTRIPIIAVSASLLESQAKEAIDAGIDGWILKPVDFKRLKILFSGLMARQPRVENMYQPGDPKAWDRGGWLVDLEQ